MFGDRDWPYIEDNNILTKLREIPNNNQDILNELKNLQINYYNNFDRWERLDLMQLYLNHVRPSYVLAYNPISPIDYGTSNFLESYAIQNKNGSSVMSPFHPNYMGAIINQMFQSFHDFNQALSVADRYVTNKRYEVINEAMASMSDDAFLATNAIIRDLNYDINSSEAKWLSSHLNESINIHDFLLSSKIGTTIPNNVINFTKESINILDSNLSNSKQLNQFLVVHENFDPTLTNNLPKEEYEARIKHYIKSFAPIPLME